MKKLLVLVLSLTLIISMLTACSSGAGKESGTPEEVATEGGLEDTAISVTPTEEADNTEPEVTTEPEVIDEAEAEPASDNTASVPVKTGMGIMISISDQSKDAGGEDGLVQTGTTVAAVFVDSEGVITKCVLNSTHAKFNITSLGVTKNDAASMVSLSELGEKYGLKASSSIGKEWKEQAEALADYVEGKTLDQVKGIAISEGGNPTEADLTSAVTISIGDMLAAIEKAVNSAEDIGASSDDLLGIGIFTSIGPGNKNASASDGVAEAYYHYATVSFDEEEKITSSFHDACQVSVAFTKEGKITTDLSKEYPTKLELKDDYGMKGSSGIGKEWYEQSRAFSDYMKGKTIAEVSGIAVNGYVKSSATDLVSSVTVYIGYAMNAVNKAFAGAK